MLRTLIIGCCFMVLNLAGVTFGHGYIIYCPCMGRFGNQMEQFLGVLSFAKALNRTLMLPPILEYPEGAREARMHEFDTYFQLEPLGRYHRVVLLRDFMHEIAPRIWPENRRTVLCWSPRPGLSDPKSMGCHATEGNPFGPFWRYAGVKFLADAFFGQHTGGFDADRQETTRRKWQQNFPIHSHPVLAFSSAPASFPARPEHRPLQQYLRWNDQIEANAIEFSGKEFGQQNGSKFVAIHLRNNLDWDNVCDLLKEENDRRHPTHLFASAQCTGDANEFGPLLTVEACRPPLDTVLKEITTHVLRIKASGVFVASDRHHHIGPISTHLAKSVPWPVRVIRLGHGHDLSEELALLGLADHFIANCVSTFSAFVVRQRHFALAPNGTKKATTFLAFPGAAMEFLPRREIPKRNKMDEDEL